MVSAGQGSGFQGYKRVCVTHDEVTGKSRVGHGLVTGKRGVFRSQHFTNLRFHIKTRGFGQLQLQTRAGFTDRPDISQCFGFLGKPKPSSLAPVKVTQ